MKKNSAEIGTGQKVTPENRFRVELDLHLFFVPLMRETGDGITLTRTLDLPFPPNSKIMIGGRSIEGDCIPPLGYGMSDIIWDIDRETFLAKTVTSHHGSPIAFIPSDIETYFQNGWQIGSWQDFYDRDRKCPIGKGLNVGKFDFDWEDEDELFLLETTGASKRPEQFNLLFSALIRMLFVLRNNEAVGYAMYKSKLFFQDEAHRTPEFSKLVDEYYRMGDEDREKVRRNVMSRSARFG